MEVFLLCLFIDLVDCSSRIIFFSNDEQKSYDDAKKFCQSLNGSLLNYGNEIVKAAEQCKMQDFAWLGLPWTETKGCFNYTNEGLGDSQKQNYNSSLFSCSSFCQEETFNYIGISMSFCWCFQKFNVNIRDSPDECKEKCPGNQADLCGVKEHIHVYQKVRNLTVKETRQTFQYSSKNGVRLHADQPLQKLNFFCSVPKDDVTKPSNIECQLRGNVGKSFPTKEVQKSSGSSVTEFVTSKKSVTTSTKEGYTLQHPVTTTAYSTDDSSYLILIIAIVGSVVMVLIIVAGATCFLRKRKRKLQETKAVTKSETNKQPSECDHGLSDTAAKKDEIDNTYDHACHSLLQTNDTTGNIYDHANSPEGMYDTTVIKNKCYEEDNPYDRVETLLNSIKEV